MTEEVDSGRRESNAAQKNKNSEATTVPITGDDKTKAAASNNEPNDSQKTLKPPTSVRLWRGFARRRSLRSDVRKKHTTKANWAEKTTAGVAVCVLIVSVIQAGIYKRQADLMDSSIKQNGDAIIVNKGQLAVANRSAITAEDTLHQIARSNTDTHTLAQESIPQANAAVSTARTASNALIIEQRPWIAEDMISVRVKETDDPKTPYISDVQIAIKNFGHSPALQVSRDLWQQITVPGGFSASIRNSCNNAERMMDIAKGLPVFPEQKPPRLESQWPWTEADLDSTFFIIGCIAYRSQFAGDRVHHTSICTQSAATLRDFLQNNPASQDAGYSCIGAEYIAD